VNHLYQWIKKSIVILIAICTFGVIPPSHPYWNDSPTLSTKSKNESSVDTLSRQDIEESERFDREDWLSHLFVQVEQQSYLKLGDKIAPVIESDFSELVLPELKKTIEKKVAHFTSQELQNIKVSPLPKNNRSEKIFHLVSHSNGTEVFRFHVRTEHPPKKGYFFAFHYHDDSDNFESHQALGTIFWSKDTPPKWGTRKNLS
jgi:hypothetical protein